MAYRTPAGGGSGAHLQLCAGCGAAATLQAKDSEFRCHRCGLDQPARPQLLPDRPVEVTPLSHVAAPYRHLVALGRTLGIDQPCSQLTLRCDGIPCSVGLEIDSGLARGLELDAPTIGLASIAFSVEGDREVEAKGRGVSREVQLGDEPFDRRVYITTDAVDEEVHAMLAAPAVRAALLTLLEGGGRVDLSPTHLRARVRASSAELYEPARVMKLLAALRVLAGAPRALAPRKSPRSVANRIATVLALASIPIGLVVAVYALTFWVPVRFTLVVLGAVGGVLLAALVQPLLTRALRGRSSSHDDLGLVRVATFIGLIPLVPGAAVLANAWLDDSRERQDVLTIAGVSPDDEDDERTYVHARGPADVGEVRLAFQDPLHRLRPGHRLVIWTRDGALGSRWLSRPARAYAGAVQLRED